MEKIEKIYTQDWFSRHIPYLSDLLTPFKLQPGLKFLEIGSFEGRSTCFFLDSVLTGLNCQIHCIDTFEGSAEHKDLDLSDLYSRFKHNTSEYGDKVTVFRGSSSERLVDPEVRQNQYDLIYVDGSHHAREVLEDAVLAFPLLKDGGLMLFDDYMGADPVNAPTFSPKMAVDSFINCYAQYLEIVRYGYQMCIQKVPRKVLS